MLNQIRRSCCHAFSETRSRASLITVRSASRIIKFSLSFHSPLWCSYRPFTPSPYLLSTFFSSNESSKRNNHTDVPLSILSWSVDGSLHSHHGFRRRFPLEMRIPYIIQCLNQCQADVVALQDSTYTIRQLLCSSKNCEEESRLVPIGKEKGAAHPLQSSASPSSCSLLQGTTTVAAYDCVNWGNNGRCGELQLFCRRDSPWKASPFLRGAGVSMLLSPREGANRHDEADGITGSESRRLSSSTSLPHSYSTSQKKENPLEVVITNVDLSYRGKSLGFRGRLLASSDQSLHGSPFDFPSSLKTRSLSGKRPHGQLDEFRDVALQYISSVNKPDILVGNFYMSQSETLPGYRDAWELGGSPAAHERTTNTFRMHRIDKDTNYYYFIPSLRPCSRLPLTPTPVDARENVENERKTKEEGKKGTRELGLTACLEGTEELVCDQDKVGVLLPLTSYRRPSHSVLTENTNKFASSFSSSAENKRHSKDRSLSPSHGNWKWVVAKKDEGDDLLKSTESENEIHKDVSKATSQDRNGESVLSTSSSSLISSGERQMQSPCMKLEMPEVAGRYQRCFFSLRRQKPSIHSSVLSKRNSPFFKSYESVRVIVPKPLSLETKLDFKEVTWQASRMTKKGRKNVPSENSSSVDLHPVNLPTVACAPSSQYPLLVVLN